jgi:hypothetical protein
LIIKLVATTQGHRYLLFLLRYLFQQQQATTQEFGVLVLGENKFFGCALVRHNSNIELASLRQPHTDFVALSFSSLVDPMIASRRREVLSHHHMLAYPSSRDRYSS